MSQYGWRIGSAAAGALALVVAERAGWSAAYLVCACLRAARDADRTVMGEPHRHRERSVRKSRAWRCFRRSPARSCSSSSAAARGSCLLFILIHKIGDTLANLTFRLLFDDLGFSNDEIALYDVGLGFWALMAGIFIGGILYARLGMKRSVLLSLVLMGVSNLALPGSPPSATKCGMGLAIGFENFASGIGGVVVVAYFSALCNLRFTAAQYRADLGGGEQSSGGSDRHHRGRADRGDRLRRTSTC
jgi:PAT family beta-lactamase induction signal transducer AmpG